MTCQYCQTRNQVQSLYCARCGKLLFKSKLRIDGPHGENQTMLLFARDYTIGRGPDNDISIPDPSLSRRHAIISHKSGNFVVRNVSNKNGSLLNDKPLTHAVLKDRDSIQLGNVMLHYCSEAPAFEVGKGMEETEFFRRQFLQLFDFTKTHLSTRESILDVLALTMSISDANHVQLFTVDADGKWRFRMAKKYEHTRSPAENVDATAQRLFRQALDSKCPQLLNAEGTITSSTEDDCMTKRWTRIVFPLIWTHRNGAVSHQTIGLCYFIRDDSWRCLSSNKQRMFEKFMHQLAMALENERLYRASREHQKMAEELQRASHVQKKLHGIGANRIPGFEIETLVKSSKGISGDYFDVIRLSENKVLFAIGDICGSGVPAALVSSSVQATVRSQMRYSTSPRRLLNHLNLLLRQSTNDSTFVTLFVGVLDPSNNQLTYLNAGHPPPFLISRDKKLTELKSTNPPLGVIKQSYSVEKRVEFCQTGTLVMYTDGLLECQNQTRERLGRNRLHSLITRQVREKPQSDEMSALRILRGIETEMTNFIQGATQTDDMTLIVATRGSDNPGSN